MRFEYVPSAKARLDRPGVFAVPLIVRNGRWYPSDEFRAAVAGKHGRAQAGVPFSLLGKFTPDDSMPPYEYRVKRIEVRGREVHFDLVFTKKQARDNLGPPTPVIPYFDCRMPALAAGRYTVIIRTVESYRFQKVGDAEPALVSDKPQERLRARFTIAGAATTRPARDDTDRAIEAAIRRWQKRPLFGPPGLTRSRLDIRIRSVWDAISPTPGKVAGKAVDILALPIEVTNRSAEKIRARIAHEWHGGIWPPTDLYACVVREGRHPAPSVVPVYLTAETPRFEHPPDPDMRMDYALRMDWPGTGSRGAVPLMDVDRPGKYRVKVLLVFQAAGRKQFVESPMMRVTVKAPKAGDVRTRLRAEKAIKRIQPDFIPPSIRVTKRPQRIGERQAFVAVPRVMQVALYRRVLRMAEAVFAGGDLKSIRNDVAAGLLRDHYLVGSVGTAVEPWCGFSGAGKAGAGVRVNVSVPSGRRIALSLPPVTAGELADAGIEPKRHLDQAQADWVATTVVDRLSRAGLLEGFALRIAKRGLNESEGVYHFSFRAAEAAPPHVEPPTVRVELSGKTGMLRLVRLTGSLRAPKEKVDPIVASARKAFKGFDPRRLSLEEAFWSCQRRMLLKYSVGQVNREPGRRGIVEAYVKHDTWWDVETGKVVYSQDLNGGRPDKPYIDRAFLAKAAPDVCRANLAKLIAARAAELASPATQPAEVGWSKPVKGLRWRVSLEGGRFEPDKPSVFIVEFENVSDKPLRIIKNPHIGKGLTRVVCDVNGQIPGTAFDVVDVPFVLPEW